jgi:hypothetical protein
MAASVLRLPAEDPLKEMIPGELSRRPSSVSLPEMSGFNSTPMLDPSPSFMPNPDNELLGGDARAQLSDISEQPSLLNSPAMPTTPSAEHTYSDCADASPKLGAPSSPLTSPGCDFDYAANQEYLAPDTPASPTSLERPLGYVESEAPLQQGCDDTAAPFETGSVGKWACGDNTDAALHVADIGEEQPAKRIRYASEPDDVAATEAIDDEVPENGDDSNDDDYQPERDVTGGFEMRSNSSDNQQRLHKQLNQQQTQKHPDEHEHQLQKGVKRGAVRTGTAPYAARMVRASAAARDISTSSKSHEQDGKGSANFKESAASHTPSSKEKFTRTYAEGVQHLIRRARAPFVQTGQWRDVELKVDAELSKYGLKKNNKGEYFRRIAANLFGEGVLDREGKWYSLMKSPKARRRFLRILVWLLSDKQWKPSESEIERLYSRQGSSRGDASNHFEWNASYAATVPSLAEKHEYSLPIRMPEPDDPSLPASLAG